LAILSFRPFGEAYTALLLSLWIGISFIFQGISIVAAWVGERDLRGRGWHIVVGIWLVIIGITQIIQHSKPARAPTPHAKRSTTYQIGWPPP
jgi:uncharacterized membrane protein HdeD (DUF308 family)